MENPWSAANQKWLLKKLGTWTIPEIARLFFMFGYRVNFLVEPRKRQGKRNNKKKSLRGGKRK